MRIWKWLALGAAGCLILLGLAALLLVFVVDPNRFRGRIEAAVSEAAGREFRLGGDLELAFFPLLGVESGPGEIANPATGFPQEPFARWREASVSARLLPLLRGRLVVDTVRIEGLELRLHRNAEGAGNWEGLGAGGGGSSGEGTQFESLAGLELRDARILYLDERSKRRIDMRGLSLDLGGWRPGEFASLETTFELDAGGRLPRATVEIEGEGRLVGPKLELRRVGGEGMLVGGWLAGERIPWSFELPEARVDFGAEDRRSSPGANAASGTERVSPAVPNDEVRFALAMPQLELRLGETRTRASADLAAPDSGRGRLTLQTPSLRALLRHVGATPPRTRDPQALGRLTLEAPWLIEPGALTIESLALSLDETRFEGRLAAPRGASGVIRFALRGDRMDLGRYLEPEDGEGEPFELPLETLHALAAEGTITLESARLDDITMKGVRLALVFDEKGLRGRGPQDAPPPAAANAQPPPGARREGMR